MNQNNQAFTYTKNVDIQCLNFTDNLETIVAIASEHGFRGISVPLARIGELSKSIKASGRDIKAIALVDFPYGDQPTEIRKVGIMSAKQTRS